MSALVSLSMLTCGCKPCPADDAFQIVDEAEALDDDWVRIGVHHTPFYRYDVVADTLDELASDLPVTAAGTTADGLVVITR